MKYIEADKLIAEIEMWRDKEKKEYNESIYSMGRCDALSEFRNHIVSLLEEQPSDDLEKAAEKYAFENFECEDYHNGDYFDPIGFAEESFIAGADWQKEQMMKGAVDGKIVSLPARNDIEMKSDEFSNATANFKDGQKVKVIIVKEDAE